MHEPDPEVVASAGRGDVEAFGVIVRAYQADVWRFSMGILRDPNLADDVTQDTFVRAFRFIDRFGGTSRFSTWLFSIARNCAIDELRRSSRRDRIDLRVQAEPARRTSEIGVALEIREAVGTLPVELRESVLLIDMFGLTYKEVAKLMDVPVGTVKSRVHKGRALLAERLLPDDAKGAADE